MTRIADVLAETIAEAKFAKEYRIKNGKENPIAMISGYRGEHCVAMIAPLQMDRDVILRSARVAATGMSLDLISLAFEVYLSVDASRMQAPRINPFTGRPWEYGDMQRAAEDGHLGDGVIDEGITVAVYNRAGDVAMTTMPFRLGPNGSIEWLPEFGGDELNAQIGGGMHETLTDVMREQVLTQKREWREAAKSMTPETLFAIGDVSTAKVLLADCEVALQAEPGTERAGVFERSGVWKGNGRRP